MLKSILKALLLVFVPILLLITTSIALCYIVNKLQGSLVGDVASCLVIIAFVTIYSGALGKIGNLIDRL